MMFTFHARRKNCIDYSFISCIIYQDMEEGAPNTEVMPPSKDDESDSSSDSQNDNPELEDDSSTSDSDEDSDKESSAKKKTRKFPPTQRIPIESFFLDKPSKDLVVAKSSSLVKKTSSEQLSENVFLEDQTKKITFTITRELFVRPNKYNKSLTRDIKMTKNPQRPYLVVEEDIDYTPKRAIMPDNPEWVRQPILFQFPRPPMFMDYKPDDILVKGRKFTQAELDKNNQLENLDATIESTISLDDFYDDIESIKPPSMFPLKLPQPPRINKKKIIFKLKETETVVLLYVVSRASGEDDEEGKLIAKSNTQHETVQKRLRKKMENYCQTSKDTRKRIKETQLPSNSTANKYAFSNNWDYYDTLEQEKKKTEIAVLHEVEQKVGLVENIKYAEVKSKTGSLVGPNFIVNDRLKWFRMGMIMERVLLSNNALKRQLLFHDHLQNDPYSDNVEFKYELKHLWTLRTSKTKGLAVTSMSWNMHEHNILAVGYGKYNFSDKCKGIVAIWNNKNLAHPEKQFEFQHPVTSLSFCKTYPDILAVAFYSGWVILINVIRQEGVKIIAQNMSFVRTSVSPVWAIAWLLTSGYKFENIVECRGNGCVYQYVRRHIYEKKPIMQISKMKGTVKGISHPRRCHPYVIPLVRNPAILCIAIHPDESGVYFIGSDEGGVYKCSLQDVNQHMDMFLAHNGPVYTIQFHPACSKIFLTCGADWYIRVWGDGIYSPLLSMISGISAVQSASWSPYNPTIIISITTTRTELWDISRRVICPQAIYNNPSGKLNTSLTFSKCGQNLCVGDKDGNVFVYALSNMPFTPSNADMVLALILIKALTPHRKLLNELYRLGPPFNVPRIYKNFLNLS